MELLAKNTNIGYTSRLWVQCDSPLKKIPGRTPIIYRRLVSFTTIHDEVYNHVPSGLVSEHHLEACSKCVIVSSTQELLGQNLHFNKNVKVQEALIYSNGQEIAVQKKNCCTEY